MEIQDGFIVSIFNYCDSWCDRCAFTSRCRLFADRAELEATFDPHLRPLLEAPPRPEEVPPPPPRWMQELIDEMNEAALQPMSDEELDALRPRIAAEHEPIRVCAEAYGNKAHQWLRHHDGLPVEDPADPRTVIDWFRTLIQAKVYRALTGLSKDVPADREWPADHDGSAKVALLGIEQSHVAWLQMAERGLASGGEVAALIADLVWLGEALERVFPNARAFVRPAFDEPDAVARLRALEGV